MKAKSPDFQELRLSCHCPDQRFEDPEAFRATQFLLAGALGMGHHAQDIAPRIADAGEPLGLASAVMTPSGVQ